MPIEMTTIEEGAGEKSRPLFGAAVLGIAAVVIVGAFLAGRLFQPGGSSLPDSVSPLRFSITLPSGAPLALGRAIPLGFDMSLLDISPDGTRLVYVADVGATSQLFVSRIGEYGAVPLPGTEGATNPFFSPDGDWVGYVSGLELRKVPIAGGRPETLYAGSTLIAGAAWSDDHIYFLDGAGATLRRVTAAGGVPDEIGRAQSEGYTNFWQVATLPEGRGVIVAASRFSPMSADYRDILVWSPATEEWHTVLEAAGYDARYAPSGHLVFARAGGLRAVRFDLERLEVVGDPKPVLEGVRVDPLFSQAQFAFSDTGTLVYARGGDASVGVPTWVDRDGRLEPTDMPPDFYGVFSISPDGKRLAIHVAGRTDQVWIYDLVTGQGRGLTTEGNNSGPIWSPDGERVAFSSNRSEAWGIYVQAADGRGEPVKMLPTDGWILPMSWSRDGLLAYIDSNFAGGLLSIEDGLDPEPVAYPQEGRFQEWGHRFSHDGRWLAYLSDRDGVPEIWVRPVPELEPEYKVSAGGGAEPIFSADGTELFFRNQNRWMAAKVTTDPSFASSPPRELFQTTFVDTFGVSWDLAPDGRFLVIKPSADDSDPSELRIVLNWFEELERLAPAD